MLIDPLINDRLTTSSFALLYHELRNDNETFFNYFRMSISSCLLYTSSRKNTTAEQQTNYIGSLGEQKEFDCYWINSLQTYFTTELEDTTVSIVCPNIVHYILPHLVFYRKD